MLARATPPEYGDPVIIDETLEPTNFARIQPGDVVGIGIHTMNATRGYAVGRQARARGATVVFGGVHASLFPEEALSSWAARTASSSGTATRLAGGVGRLPAAESRSRRYDGGSHRRSRMAAARWDLLPADPICGARCRPSEGCPKHCSFCSVWRTDGQRPRLIPPQVVREIVELRRLGFRFIFLSDDNFYPVTLQDLGRRGAAPTPRSTTASGRSVRAGSS